MSSLRMILPFLNGNTCMVLFFFFFPFHTFLLSLVVSGFKTDFSRRDKKLSFWNLRCYVFIYTLCWSFCSGWIEALRFQNVCPLVLTVWGSALEVLVKTHMVSGRNNASNLWFLPPSLFFFYVRHPWESNESWPCTAHTHTYFAYNLGLFLDFPNPSYGSTPSYESLLSYHCPLTLSLTWAYSTPSSRETYGNKSCAGPHNGKSERSNISATWFWAQCKEGPY